MNYGDILWVEDFDDGDSSPKETKIGNYYGKYSFRVDVQSEMLPLLKKLADERIFSKYSCVVLDINLELGFSSVRDEFAEIKKRLEENQIRVLDEHNVDNDDVIDEIFAKNAGYYVYLYLIRRGFPAERICMLTGNKGNTTSEWEKLFNNAGLMPPEAFDRESECENFRKWIAKKLTPPYRFRACIVGMSRCTENFVDEEKKVILKNLPQIPLRFSENITVADVEFVSVLWQIIQPWESLKISAKFGSVQYAYQVTLKTARNWMAHTCLGKYSLLSTIFLFGIGLRGLLGEEIGGETAKEYKIWEEELLSLLKELDKGNSSPIKKELVMKSCKEFFNRITDGNKNCKIALESDISKIIHEIGQKNNKIERHETDLLRNFLHGIYPIKLERDKEKFFNPHEYGLGILFKTDDKTFSERKNTTEAKYLNAISNTLNRAVKL